MRIEFRKLESVKVTTGPVTAAGETEGGRTT